MVNITDIGKEAQDILDNLTKTINGTGEAGGLFSSMMTTMSNSLLQGVAGAKSFTDALRGASTMSTTAANAFSMMSAQVLGVSKAFDGFSAWTSNSPFQSITSQVTSAIEPLSKMTGGLQMLAGALGIKAPAGVKLTTEFMKEQVAMIGQHVDAAQRFQNSYLQMMLSSGQGAELFRVAGRDLSNLNGILKNQGVMMTQVAGATGVALSDMANFYTQLGQIPGALQETTSSVGGATGGVEAWVAAVDIAQGAGMNLGDAIKQLKVAYDTFGKTGDAANEFLARQAELSDKLGIPLDKTTSYLDTMAKSFQFLGDNSRGASEALQSMFQTLRADGVGVEPALKIAQDMGEAMTKLSVGQEAYISSRGGGRGGIAGALDMELAMRDTSGKGMKDVQDKMRKAYLSQIGGNAITMQQAHDTGQEAQFMKERASVQSIYGVQDKAEAGRIVDLLAKPPTEASTKKIAELLQDSRDKGARVAEQNRTLFTQISADVESVKMFGGLEMLAAIKSAFGINNKSEKFQNQLAEDKARAAAYAHEANRATKEGQDASADLTGKMGRDTIDRAKLLTTGSGDVLHGMLSGVTDQNASAAGAADQKAARDRFAATLNTTPTLTPKANADLNRAIAQSVGEAVVTQAPLQHHAVQAAMQGASSTQAAGAHAPTVPHSSAKRGKEEPVVNNITVFVNGQPAHNVQVQQAFGSHPATDPDPGY